MLRGRRLRAYCRAALPSARLARAQAPPARPGRRKLARVRTGGCARVAVLSWGLTGRYSCNAIRSRLITNRSDWDHARPLPGKSRLRHDWNTLVVRVFRHVWRVLRLKVRTPQQPYGASPDHSRRQLPLGRRQCGVAVLHRDRRGQERGRCNTYGCRWQRRSPMRPRAASSRRHGLARAALHHRRIAIKGTPYLVGARRCDGAPGSSLCKKEPRPWGQPHTSKEVADPGDSGYAAG